MITSNVPRQIEMWKLQMVRVFLTLPLLCIADNACPDSDSVSLLQTHKISSDSQARRGAPSGFEKVGNKGYCSTFEDGSSKAGMGVHDVSPGGDDGKSDENLNDCRDKCLTSSGCVGFASAPDVEGHTACHLFRETPISTDNSWGWECYAKSTTEATSLYEMLGLNEKCGDGKVITGFAECEEATKALGIYDWRMDAISSAKYTSGCILQKNGFPWVNFKTTQRTHPDYKPICSK
eukprot:TRINITY_DN323_c0_g1_i15.p1 TRINITY_DN323_c0_g1~~TRINITY_DN323_c0_g1_i15.p1  ORF type:complete len:235 (-),score=31.90 TRINITY_DN323_c0_g1_i15:148-852(-)